MKNLRTSFERFCLRNRNKGIPNLMLYIIIGSAVVYILSLINGGSVLYEFLRFDKALILKGQVWRLVTYVLTYSPGSNPFLILISFYFFYMLSRDVEASMGTFRYNIFYFSGVVLMDVFAMIFCPSAPVSIGGQVYPAEIFTYSIYASMGFYLHLSILLMYASTNPDARFLVFFFIPVKAWFLGLVYVVLIAIDIYNMASLFPHNLFPLVGLLNYLLFAGRDVANLFPFLKPTVRRRKPKAQPQQPQQQNAPRGFGSIPFRGPDDGQRAAYNHRCTVCGRTDATDPELEFRYCSRCNGYYCYCQEHINIHTHIE